MNVIIFLVFAISMVTGLKPVTPTSVPLHYNLPFEIFKNYRVVQEPSHPIFYHGIAFYWSGAYIPSPERPETCIILASHPEWPFDGNVFQNGTIPTAALFGCHERSMCSGTRCIEPYTHFNVVTYTLLGIVLFLLVCLLGGEPKNKEKSKRRVSRHSTLDNIFLPCDHQIRVAVPPEYTH
ncbi:CX domain-containing protein [Caenorhabditis elegans]|uniref:CX domain-containing protein n=1 Tax=Caenorhabditis elegans TaxID=6239 RepID=E3CTG6_CAEEL|nr:CX domain-containing protein [Caenorhabditis elegans]CCD67016.2 CX domain-containing protein [Caenorhabditis elegans]|eukprot:NP_001343635.1 Uncharacterized protein CELE_R02F11.10 [Caenorhabditis elegans]